MQTIVLDSDIDVFSLPIAEFISRYSIGDAIMQRDEAMLLLRAVAIQEGTANRATRLAIEQFLNREHMVSN